MKRNAINELIHWKEQESNIPLFITGIKGSGKTFLALDFAKNFFEGYIYINFETNFHLRELFLSGATLKEKSFLNIISEEFEIPTELLPNVLIVFDEVSFVIHEINYFINYSRANLEILPNIIMISSIGDTKPLDFIYKHIRLFPLDFGEFLDAIGSKWYAEVIEGHFANHKKIPGIVHDELLELFDDYLTVGGMPGAINDYLTNNSFDNIPEIHIRTYDSIINFLSKNSFESDALKIKQIAEVLPAQFMKDNKKFQFNYIRKGVTRNLYKSAVDKLVCSGFTIQSKPYGETDDSAYKLYCYDSGTLKSLLESSNYSNITDTSKKTANISERIFYENYIAQILCSKNKTFGFWESSSSAHLEFILNDGENVVPIEIKTANNSKSKSMSVYIEKNNPTYSIRISHKNFEFSNGISNIPYYAIYCI